MTPVREARPADAAAIAAVHVRSWQHTYRGLFPDEYLDSLTVADRLGWWTAWLAQPPEAPEAVLVVEDSEGLVVGFATTGAADDVEAGAVGAIYLEPGSWRRGLGTALLSAAMDRLRAEGYPSAVLWVHPANARARSFYEATGWSCDDVERHQTVWGVDAPEVRYRKSL